jgi:Glyoxalase-like domain
VAAVHLLPVAFFHPAIVTTMAGMALRLHHIVVDAHDLPALARFWAQALGWLILSEREQEVVIGRTRPRRSACASCRCRT